MTETSAFEVFMKNYQNMVFSTAMRLLGNETDAADISQEVFLKAYQHFGDLASSERAGGWLKTVATNLCLNHLTRYRARWKPFSDMFSADSDEDFASTIAAPDAAATEIDLAHDQQLLESTLQKLPPAQRVPLVLYHFEEMSYEEIAAKLKVSVGKVKTDIHRGREALRNKLTRTADGQITQKFQVPQSKTMLFGCV